MLSGVSVSSNCCRNCSLRTINLKRNSIPLNFKIIMSNFLILFQLKYQIFQGNFFQFPRPFPVSSKYERKGLGTGEAPKLY